MLDSSALCSIFMDHQHRTAGLGGKQCTHRNLLALAWFPLSLTHLFYQVMASIRPASILALLSLKTSQPCFADPSAGDLLQGTLGSLRTRSASPFIPTRARMASSDSSQHRYRLWWWTKTQTWPSSHPETTLTHAERHSWTQGSWHWHFEKYAFPPSFCSCALLGKQGLHHKPSTWRAAAFGSVGTIQPRISTGLLWDGSGQWTHSLNLCLNTGCFLSRGPQLPTALQRAQPCRYQSSIQRQELQHSMGRSFGMPDLAEYFIGMQDATPDPGAEKKL